MGVCRCTTFFFFFFFGIGNVAPVFGALQCSGIKVDELSKGLHWQSAHAHCKLQCTEGLSCPPHGHAGGGEGIQRSKHMQPTATGTIGRPASDDSITRYSAQGMCLLAHVMRNAAAQLVGCKAHEQGGTAAAMLPALQECDGALQALISLENLYKQDCWPVVTAKALLKDG